MNHASIRLFQTKLSVKFAKRNLLETMIINFVFNNATKVIFKGIIYIASNVVNIVSLVIHSQTAFIAKRDSNGISI